MRGAATRTSLSVVLVLVVAAMAIPSTPAASAVGRAAPKWHSSGPLAGYMVDVEVAPSNDSVVYAVSETLGVFKSLDGGAHWFQPGRPAHASGFNDLAVHPSKPAVVWLATFTGMYKSLDGGATWKLHDAGLGSQAFMQHVAVSPSAPAHLYAAGGFPGKAYRSEDGGLSWSPANGGMKGHDVRDVEVDPADPDTAYAATPDGAFRTTNSGQHWDPTALVSDVATLAIDPTAPSTVYAGGFGGLFRTDSGGITWPLKVSGLTNGTFIQGVAVDPVVHTLVYVTVLGGGIWSSTSQGDSWGALGQSGFTPSAIEVDPMAHATVFAASFGTGVIRSVNTGSSFQAVNAGLIAGTCFDVDVVPGEASTVLAAIYGSGAYRTTDSGADWTDPNALPASGIGGETVETVAVSPSNSAFAYAGGASGIFASSDGGVHWSPASTGLPQFTTVYDLLVSKGNSSRALAATSNGVFQTTNGGGTWTPSGSGMPSGSVTHLASSPSNGAVVYAGMFDHGVFRSADFGDSWSPRNTTIQDADISSLSVNPSNPNVVYAGTEFPSNLYRSSNGGQTWVPHHAGIPLSPRRWVTSVVFDPSDPATEFLSLGESSRVFRTSDGGASWTKLTPAVPRSPIRDLDITPDGHRLYACTQGSVWQRSIG